MKTFHPPAEGLPLYIDPEALGPAAGLAQATAAFLESHDMPNVLRLHPIDEGAEPQLLPLTRFGQPLYVPEFYARQTAAGEYGVHTVFPMTPDGARWSVAAARYAIHEPAEGFTGWGIRVNELAIDGSGSLAVALGGLARALDTIRLNELPLPGYEWQVISRPAGA